MTESIAPIVVDNGSGMTKAGFAGDEAPKAIFPTVVGRPRLPGIIVGPEQKEVYVGEEAKSKDGILDIKYPIQKGIITNWDDMERIWHHTFFSELKIPTDEHPVLLTETPLNPIKNREKTTEIMFETFNVPGFYLATQAVLSLYASCKTTGLVLDSGEGITHSVPIYEGYAIPFAIRELKIAGNEITEFLSKLLKDKGHVYIASEQHAISKEIKEKLGFVAKNFESESANTEIEYCLPDGKSINVGKERFLAPEVLFKPSLIGDSSQGCHMTVVNSINDCDEDIRRDFYSNVILSGGSTLFSGLGQRLESEIGKLAPEGYKVGVVEKDEREFLAWIGGSIISSMTSSQQMWVSKAEYDGFGPSIVQRKCF